MESTSAIQHIVLYSFTDAEVLGEAVSLIKSLSARVLRNNQPYILSIQCGSTRPSAPVRSLGYNLASVVTFASDADRVYFIKNDPAHRELVEFVTGKLNKDILVLDFIDGLGATVASDAC